MSKTILLREGHSFYSPHSLYKALKLTFPWDIGGLTTDSQVKTVLRQRSIGKSVDILIPTMFKLDGPHEKF